MSDDPPRSEQVNPASAQLDGAPTSAFVDAMLDDQRGVLDAVRLALPEIVELASEIARVYAAGGRIVLVGAGTSGRLAVLEAAECPPTFGIDPERIVALIAGGSDALTRSIEGAEDDAGAGVEAISAREISGDDLVVGISASGSTPYVIGAIQAASERAAVTFAIAGNAGSPLCSSAQRAIVLDCGPEFVAGSTRLKAGSAQKLALNLATTGAMRELGRVRSGRMVAVQATNAKLRARALRTLLELTDLSAGAAKARLDAAGGDLFRVLAQYAPPPLEPEPQPLDATLRFMTADDAVAVAALAGDPGVVDSTAPFARLGGAGLFRGWLARPGLMLGAFVEADLAGVILLETRHALLREHVADITYIAVLPRFGGRGLGERLVRHALTWAETQGYPRVELRVWPDNVRAVRLYSRLGFSIEGRMRAHAIVEGRIYDALLMAWLAPEIGAAGRRRKEPET